MRATALALSLMLFAAPAAAQFAPPPPPRPLFASDEPIRLTIQAPLSSLISDRINNSRPGTIAVAVTPGTYPIMLEARGITRRQSDICQFPPLRIDFTGTPAGLFGGQNRLKLVTHCRREESFQQKVLLEYAAYRLYNVLTPLSFRARLATIDYVEENGRPFVTRAGFLIEDIDDVAARNFMVKPRTPDRVPLGEIDPRAGARFALFNYMIGNLDWSMRAGPVGEGCCHNARLLASSGTAGALIPVPYDFDYSGLVDAPYALPPQGVPVRSVRERYYRGYCAHANEARAVAAEIAGRRSELLATLASIPGLEERTRARAASYLEGFFKDVASGKLFASCVG